MCEPTIFFYLLAVIFITHYNFCNTKSILNKYISNKSEYINSSNKSEFPCALYIYKRSVYVMCSQAVQQNRKHVVKVQTYCLGIFVSIWEETILVNDNITRQRKFFLFFNIVTLKSIEISKLSLAILKFTQLVIGTS